MFRYTVFIRICSLEKKRLINSHQVFIVKVRLYLSFFIFVRDGQLVLVNFVTVFFRVSNSDLTDPLGGKIKIKFRISFVAKILFSLHPKIFLPLAITYYY